jgi:hypothetical protein
MERLIKLVGPFAEDRATVSEVGDFIQNLEDALEAVRYHQRQFLVRYSIESSLKSLPGSCRFFLDMG